MPIPTTQREFTVKVEETAIGREHQLLAVSVTKSANRISSARLVYADGAAATSDFPLSNEDLFVPGQKIEILAGPGDKPVSMFKGIVIRHSLKIRDNASPQVRVECRHEAIKLTIGRKNAYFFDQTDSAVIEDVLDKASLSSDVESTSASHAQLVQYRTTDWDFILSRAQANGRLVLTNDDTVKVKKPDFSSGAVCTLLFGATILEMDADIDARTQYSAVKGITWDAAQQSLVEKEAADPKVAGPGNLSGDDLAGVAGPESYDLRHAHASEDETQAWADAEWLRSKMNKVNGRVKCEGIATVNPGDVVTLAGVGDRFNGDVLVTGVRQDFDLVQGWKTHIQFGGSGDVLAEDRNVSAPKAGALLPAVNGLQIGIVVSNEDPDGEHRVRVRLPLVNNDGDGVWARVASLDAGDDRGFFFRPEIDDEVVLGFLDDDPRRAVILGMLHSSAKPAPLEGSDDNHEKEYQSRSKMKIYFNDDKKVMKFETPAGNIITLSEEDKAVKIVDQNGNSIEMTEDGIKIESVKAIEMKAETEIKAKAGTEVKLESEKSFAVKGGTELKMEGAAGAELSSSAVTKVKGSMVQVN